MNIISILSRSVVVAALLSACNGASRQAKENAESVNHYVDSVSEESPVYTKAKWEAIDNGYQTRLTALQLSEAELNETEKAKVEESKSQYETLKTAYEAKIKEAEEKEKANDYRQILRTSLFGEGKMGADIQFNFVTADNILSVYEHFVNTVAEKKDTYSREDWDEVKVLYEALDTRKNELEKNISTKDNLKIAKQKIRFVAVKGLHRGGSKISENEKSKQ